MKSMNAFAMAVTVLCFSIGLAGCDGGGGGEKSAASAADAGARCAHEIKPDKCPFCNPQLIESEGFCGEHGVAEALCYQCRPYLKAAFRAKGDWCEDHKAPDSQCVTCHPELQEKIRPGSGHGTKSSATGVAPSTQIGQVAVRDPKRGTPASMSHVALRGDRS
jgi:hypothetical protein